MSVPPKSRLPLFPLPVVLLPTGVMPLQIFEPRYREMVERCLSGDRRFGFIYHDSDVQGPFLTEEGAIGCVAEIMSSEPLPDGRSLILVKGRERFTIEDGIESGTPYYEALVSPYGDHEEADRAALAFQRNRTLAIFHEMVGFLGTGEGEVPEFDPTEELSFPLARTVDVSPPWKQSFLALRREVHRLERLDALFRAALDAGLDP
ncbi:MAG: LON peptidase substrate-binding domain-containing protein [Gemmatimonadota bacterium]|nr:LON peptidase substrate-binding domain-containing protein [Gemmatimonadota bacterium]MDH5758799.1 LON peptidase substrate-binding domain-containing protein [Gemmatimonadota bacterium]